MQASAGMLLGEGIEGQSHRPRAIVPTLGWARAAPVASLGALDRCLLRGVAMAGALRIRRIVGAEHIAPERDPFIMVLNHGTRLEALIVPAALMLLRGGRHIHFLADWNFRMVPGIGLLYRRSGTITVPWKHARPRVLDHLKPFFTDPVPPFEAARCRLLDGRPIGIFPEGTVNRDPLRLLRGRPGAARLALETATPVVPAGLVYPEVKPGAVVPEASAIEIVIGAPIQPPPVDGEVGAHAVRALHAAIMAEIARLSGKSPKHPTDEAEHENGQTDAGAPRGDGGGQAQGVGCPARDLSG